MRTLFPKNLTPWGRWLRALLGVALLAFAFWQKSWIAAIAALFTFFEAGMGWCIILHLFGKTKI